MAGQCCCWQRVQKVRHQCGGDCSYHLLRYLVYSTCTDSAFFPERKENYILDTVCRKAYLSRNVFFKWFKEQFGISPLEYINASRIRLAKELLADVRNDIQSVSAQCGFSDVNYFIRVFRKLEGITPGSYQNCVTGRL